VLPADHETLDAMDLTPGILRENITVGLNVNFRRWRSTCASEVFFYR
jgi:hypothetical protein